MRQRSGQHHAPWTTISVGVMALGIMIHQWRLGADGAGWVNRWGTVPTRLLLEDGSLAPDQVPTLFTAIFVHVDVWHLIGNLVFLALFTPRVEHRLGPLRTLGLMIVAGALANLWGAMQSSQSMSPIVGMSGVVSAVLGAFLVLFPRSRIGVVLPLGLFLQVLRVPALLLIGSWFALQLVYTWRQPDLEAVAWWTHVAGFLSGAVLAAPARWFRPNR